MGDATCRDKYTFYSYNMFDIIKQYKIHRIHSAGTGCHILVVNKSENRLYYSLET